MREPLARNSALNFNISVFVNIVCRESLMANWTALEVGYPQENKACVKIPNVVLSRVSSHFEPRALDPTFLHASHVAIRYSAHGGDNREPNHRLSWITEGQGKFGVLFVGLLLFLAKDCIAVPLVSSDLLLERRLCWKGIIQLPVAVRHPSHDQFSDHLS